MSGAGFKSARAVATLVATKPNPRWDPAHVRTDPRGHVYYLDPLFHPLNFAEWRKIRNGGPRDLRVPQGLYARLHRGEMVLVNGVMRQGDFVRRKD